MLNKGYWKIGTLGIDKVSLIHSVGNRPYISEVRKHHQGKIPPWCKIPNNQYLKKKPLPTYFCFIFLVQISNNLIFLVLSYQLARSRQRHSYQKERGCLWFLLKLHHSPASLSAQFSSRRSSLLTTHFLPATLQLTVCLPENPICKLYL